MKDFETTVSTLEYGIKIGKILGSRQEKGVGIAFDGEKASRLFAEAIKIGIIFCGGTVYNYGEQNMPIMRSAVRFCRNDYGVYVHKSSAIDKEEIKIVLMDKYGIELSSEQTEVLINHGCAAENSGKASETSSVMKMIEAGSEKKLSEFKTYYIRHMINNVKSREFKVNFHLTTSLKPVSEVLNGILGEFYSYMNPECTGNYEFGGEITDGGDRIILEKSDGTRLSEEQAISVMTYVLLRDSNVRTFVLPESISRSAEDAILKLGGNVIRTDGGRRQRMEKMIEYGNQEQLMMEFDGVYAAVRILDFLNRFDISFDMLVEHLPNVFKAEAEIDFSDEKNNDIDKIMKRIRRKYHGSESENGRNIRIETDGGIALVVPKTSSNIIKIITEAESMEAAQEISAMFKDGIKMLVKNTCND